MPDPDCCGFFAVTSDTTCEVCQEANGLHQYKHPHACPIYDTERQRYTRFSEHRYWVGLDERFEA